MEEQFNFLKMRFHSYYEAFRDSNNMSWELVNIDYMIETLQEIKQHFGDVEQYQHEILKLEGIINDITIK